MTDESAMSGEGRYAAFRIRFHNPSSKTFQRKFPARGVEQQGTNPIRECKGWYDNSGPTSLKSNGTVLICPHEHPVGLTTDTGTNFWGRSTALIYPEKTNHDEARPRRSRDRRPGPGPPGPRPHHADGNLAGPLTVGPRYFGEVDQAIIGQNPMIAVPNNVTFTFQYGVPEPSTISLIIASCGLALTPFRRR